MTQDLYFAIENFNGIPEHVGVYSMEYLNM
jgi:hypothetical protein